MLCDPVSLVGFDGKLDLSLIVFSSGTSLTGLVLCEVLRLRKLCSLELSLTVGGRYLDCTVQNVLWTDGVVVD